MKKTLQNKNKKAQLGHGITWLWKFILLTIVLGGIIAIVASHYSKPFDVRDAEAAIISRKLAECLAPQGILNNELTIENIRNCIPINEDELYINVAIENKAVELGDMFLLTLCQAEEQKVNVKDSIACLNSKYYVLKRTQDKFESSSLSINIAVKKVEKNL